MQMKDILVPEMAVDEVSRVYREYDRGAINIHEFRAIIDRLDNIATINEQIDALANSVESELQALPEPMQTMDEDRFRPSAERSIKQGERSRLASIG